MKKELCINCGTSEATTRDHVPPKILFPKPRPNNLLTVPSCKTCNNQDSKNDEYFGHCMAFGSKDSTYTTSVLESSVRAFQRPAAKIYRAHFYENISLTNLKEFPAIIEIEPLRISSILDRIIRGLYFHQKETALQQDANIRHSMPRQIQVDHYQDDVFIRGFQNSEFQCTGDEKVFKYMFVESPDNNRYSSVWRLLFYESIEVMSTVIFDI